MKMSPKVSVQGIRAWRGARRELGNKEEGFLWKAEIWIPFPTSSWMMLSKLINISMPQFPYLTRRLKRVIIS